MGSPDSKAKYAIKAKDIPYDFNQGLDEEVISSQE